MASAGDITTVRQNTDEQTPENYSDDAISALIDANGVSGASAIIWRQKAARFAEMVDVTEAGASHKMGDLHKNALAMASTWQAQADSEVVLPSSRIRIKQIVRSDGA